MIQVLSNREGRMVVLRLFREEETMVCSVSDHEEGGANRHWNVPFNEFEALCAGETRRLEAGDLGFEKIDGESGQGLEIAYAPTHVGERRHYSKLVPCREVAAMPRSL